MPSLYIQSPITKIGLGILSVILSAAAVLYIGLREEERMEAHTLGWQGRSIENGAAIFANNCSTCHNPDGKGMLNRAPALNSHYFFTQRLADVGWTGSMEDYVRLTVSAGRPSKTQTQWVGVIMPTWASTFGGPLRPDQVQQVVDYVLNWQEAALQQTAEQDPWQCFQDVAKPCEEQIISAVVLAPSGEEAVAQGPRPPAQLFNEIGCFACHNLDLQETATSRGLVGPNMGNLPENAANRMAGMSAEEYIYTSITNPNAYVVEGYPSNVMPIDFSQRMSEEEIQALVAWLLDPNRER